MLVGAQGSGKTHMANFWARLYKARKVSRQHLVGTTNALASPESEQHSKLGEKHPLSLPFSFEHLKTPFVLIEDIHKLPPLTPDQERTFFHALNALVNAHKHVLFTSRILPTHITCALKDLRSRLHALPCVLIPPPDKELFKIRLAKHLHERHIIVKPTALDYLSQHATLSFETLRHLTHKLEKNIHAGRQLTKPTLKDILKSL